ncbi:MAG: DUF2905 domain-containing protein [Candidatus Atribacteria bacterium]|nr:DUF2905 domain-containing protein [Candidatus Atribacteria bacterium]
MEITYWAKVFLTIGIVCVVIGLLLFLLPQVPGLNRFGHFPGDIVLEKRNVTFYFPVLTGVILSLLLTFILWIISR